MRKKVICNFHGTLFSDTHAGSSWKYVGFEALKHAAKNPLRWPRAAELTIAAGKLYPLVSSYERGEIEYDKIYEFFNENVLSGIPTEVVKGYLREYARLPKTQGKVDSRAVEALHSAFNSGFPEGALQCAILSTGCSYTIRHIIDAYTRHPSLFGEIAANDLSGQNDGTHFNLDIYTPEQRRDALQWLLPIDSGVSTFYVGNEEDELPCMDEVVNAGGRAVASFMASDGFKQTLATRYGSKSFVPEHEADFLNLLRKA